MIHIKRIYKNTKATSNRDGFCNDYKRFRYSSILQNRYLAE